MKPRAALSIALGILALIGLLGADKLKLLPQQTIRSCETISETHRFSITGPATAKCWDNGQSVVEVAEAGQLVTIKFSNPNGKFLSFYSQTDGQGSLQILRSPGVSISPGFGAPSNNEGLAPAKAEINLPAGQEQILVQKNGPGLARIFNLTLKDSSSPKEEANVAHTTRLQTPWIAFGIFACAIGAMICLYPLTNRGSFATGWVYWLGVLLLAYTGLYFLEGLPFFTNQGFYDPFDDTSYLEWAHHIGFQHSLDISQGISAAARQNVHSWGTGLVLSPPFFLAKLLRPGGTGTELFVFSMLTTWSVLLGFATIAINFYGFSLVFEKWIAALVAFSMFAGTSLAKWTFGRLIFSHTPEAFSLAVSLVFFIQIYIRHRPTVLNYLGLAFGLWLTIQIRRENLLVACIPLYFESIRILAQRKGYARPFFLLGVLAFAVFSLQVTNVYTQLGSVWASVPTAGTIVFELKRFKDNFWLVLVGPNAGFFSTGVFVPLALMSLFAFRRKIHVLLPFAAVIVGYLLMCMLHAYPTGCEWQNRFLLKLNPIVFAGLGLLMHRSRSAVRSILFCIIAAGLYFQHNLYLQNLHPDQAIFADLFSDFAITNSIAFRAESFYFWPMKALLGLSATAIFALLVYLAMVRDNRTLLNKGRKPGTLSHSYNTKQAPQD